MLYEREFDNPLVINKGDTVAYMTPMGDTKVCTTTNFEYVESEERWIFTGHAPGDTSHSLWGYLDMIIEVENP